LGHLTGAGTCGLGAQWSAARKGNNRATGSAACLALSTTAPDVHPGPTVLVDSGKPMSHRFRAGRPILGHGRDGTRIVGAGWLVIRDSRIGFGRGHEMIGRIEADEIPLLVEFGIGIFERAKLCPGRSQCGIGAPCRAAATLHSIAPGNSSGLARQACADQETRAIC